MSGVEIVRAEIERYADEHTTPPTALLEALAAETRTTMASPEMLTGEVMGRLLELLVHASGRPAGARDRHLQRLFGALDGRRAAARGAGRHLRDRPAPGRGGAPVHRAEPLCRPDHGPRRPGVGVDRGLEGEFDFVFIDADKPSYVQYIEAILPRLSAHGLIAVDNTLWGGEVVDPRGETARVIADLNDRLVADSRIVVVQLTVRDGLTLIRRR